MSFLDGRMGVVAFAQAVEGRERRGYYRQVDRGNSRAIRFEEVATDWWTDDDWDGHNCDDDCIDCDFEEDEVDDLLMVGRLVLSTPTLGDVIGLTLRARDFTVPTMSIQ